MRTAHWVGAEEEWGKEEEKGRAARRRRSAALALSPHGPLSHAPSLSTLPQAEKIRAEFEAHKEVRWACPRCWERERERAKPAGASTAARPLNLLLSFFPSQADQFEAARLLARGEARLASKSHPDVYKVPYRPGGTLYARNPPVDPRLHQEFDFGREAPN